MSFLTCLRTSLFARVLVFTLILRASCIHAQRKKEGCYEAASLSCDSPRANPLELDFNLEDVCYHIMAEIFPNDDVAWDVSLHEEYLNGIEPDTELCLQIKIAYSRCIFCAAELAFQQNCYDRSVVHRCGGGLPTREEVLQNNEDEVYARFQTEQDIDDTCAALEKSYQQFYIQFPATLDLCERQDKVKHLCPGTCDGTCFDPELNPPSCDPNAYQGPFDETLDNFAVCDEVRYQAFYGVDIDVLLNVSDHPDYLRAIQGNTTDCDEARQAYSRCSFCAEEICFHEEYPATCQAPENPNYALLETIDVDHVCHDIYWAVYGLTMPDDLFNTSITKTGRILMPEDTTICKEARQVYHQCLWCAPDVPVDFCNLGTACFSNVTIAEDFESYHIDSLNLTTDTFAPELHCDQIFEHWNNTEASHFPFAQQTCYEHIYLARLCPQQFCPEAEAPQELDLSYLGATTTAEKKALIWTSRSAAFLSFLGASYILYDIFRDKKARTVYHGLLIGIAITDIITATAWCFATAPIPVEEASHVEGAMGTDATCKAQGFFIQLGFTSVFYNVSLAVYYVLVIAKDWREFHLKNVRIYLHAFPVALGLGLAVGALPIYHWIEYGCHILPPPDGDMWPVLVFVILPLGLSIIFITQSMLLVYWKVRQQASASKQWSFGVSKAGKLEQAVFWQCLFYVLAFYISWPILFAVYLASVDVNGPLGLTLTVAFVAPLQGFTNALVYARPKVFKFKPRRRNSQARNTLWTKVFRGRSFRSSQAADSTSFHFTEADRSLRGMDPSAAMALRKISYATSNPVRMQNTLSKLQEEFDSFDDEDDRAPKSDCSFESDSTGAVSASKPTPEQPSAPSRMFDDRISSLASGDMVPPSEPEQSPSAQEQGASESSNQREPDGIDMALFFEEPSEHFAGNVDDVTYAVACRPPQTGDARDTPHQASGPMQDAPDSPAAEGDLLFSVHQRPEREYFL